MHKLSLNRGRTTIEFLESTLQPIADGQFDRLKGESAKAYAACHEYCRLGPERSLAALAKKLKKSKRLLADWSAQYQWVARAQMYDQAMEVARNLELTKLATAEAQKWYERQQAANEREYQQVLEAEKKLGEMLKFPLVEATTKDGKTTVKPVKWSMSTIATWMRALAESKERVFRKQTQRSGQSAGPTFWVTQTFSDEQMEEYMKEQKQGTQELLDELSGIAKAEAAHRCWDEEGARPGEGPDDSPDDGIPRAPRGGGR